MALLIAFGAEAAGALIIAAMFSDPIPAASRPPVHGGQSAVDAQFRSGQTLGHPRGRHARQGRHGSPVTAPPRGAHTPAGRHHRRVTT